MQLGRKKLQTGDFKKTPNWRLQAILDKIIENLNRIEHYETKHIYREANAVADALSKLAAQGTFIHWWDQRDRSSGKADQINQQDFVPLGSLKNTLDQL